MIRSINSFTAETPVHTQDAEGNPKLVAISELKIGDKVLAKSEWKAQGENLSYAPITDIISTPNSEHARGKMNVWETFIQVQGERKRSLGYILL